MKKPTEAIEWLKEYGLVGTFAHEGYVQEILAYIDSIPEWPAYLTRGRLEELAMLARECTLSTAQIAITDALRRLAELAPLKEKRKVELWKHESWTSSSAPPITQYAGQGELTEGVDGWRKVGEVEIDA